MFIDNAKIYVRAGNGGNGCKSFYRDKLNRRGFPDGGDGGKGADIIIRADRNLRTLLDFQYNRHFYAPKGANGSSKNQKGKDAPDLIIRVPCGVTVRDAATACILGTLETDGQVLTVARSGKPGRGNRRGREEATFGEPGEEKELILDLRLIADVGVIGFPNAGKSTLVSSITNAKPKVAPYPFTTKFPTLGMVGENDEQFVIADIPGLIEGSSRGRGLGIQFLRHIERTKILVHLIDMSGFEARDPLEDYRIINRELKNYSKDVSCKTQVLAANKMDMDKARQNLSRFKKAIKKKIYPISALKKEGLEELIAAIRKKL